MISPIAHLHLGTAVNRPGLGEEKEQNISIAYTKRSAFRQLVPSKHMATRQNHRLSYDARFDYLGRMRVRISIASILLVTTPAVAAVITVKERTPDRPIVVVVEGFLAAFDEDQFAAKAASLSSAFVAFSSDGGSLVADLRIGEAIRRRGFSTIVPDGRRCASACALAWLGGVERFIGTSGKMSFHAAYDSASDESGVGTAVGDDAYLSKIGLPYEAVTYIAQAASNEITWLNMSDAAQRGIKVTLLSLLAKETMAAIPTRYGDVIVERDDPECCGGRIRFMDQLVPLASTSQIYASLEGVYKVKAGDLVVMSLTSGATRFPPSYYVLLVGPDGMTDLTGSEFGSSDGSFKASQRDDEVHFDLGFQKKAKEKGDLQKWNRHSGYSARGYFA
jgi:hypothetical protein